MPTRKYPNIINVFLVLTVVRVEVECRRISHVATGFVRYNRNVIAYLALVRIAFERIKRIAYGNVSRPGNASIGTK